MTIVVISNYHYLNDKHMVISTLVSLCKDDHHQDPHVNHVSALKPVLHYAFLGSPLCWVR